MQTIAEAIEAKVSTNGHKLPQPKKYGDVRLKRLNNAAIEKYQDVIKASVSDAYDGAATPAILSTSIADMLAGSLQCWAVFVHDGETRLFAGAIVTRIINTPYLGKRLFIEVINAYDRIEIRAWRNALQTLEDFARDNQCTHIDAQTGSDQAGQLGMALGFETVSVNLSKEL